jgi:hypothetical protein
MSSFDLQFDKVQQLKKDVTKLKMLYISYKKELEKETTVLQDICKHEYIRESDGDYHKPGYYYTCKKCDYFTRFTPKEFN